MIGNYKTTKQILDEYGLSAKKKFGQNFLIDHNILSKIVEAADIDENSYVVEIGPGLGSLTEMLIDTAGKVRAYEIDSDMVQVLTDRLGDKENFELVHGDILKQDIDIDKEITVVANLPYYITTPILFKLLESNLKIRKIVVMMQKEVALRLEGNPNTKDYNALSVAIQYRTTPKIAFNVSREVFIPKHNVDSSVIVLDVLDKPRVDVEDEKHFFRVVKSSFAQRRKTLVNNLNSELGIPKDILKEVLVKNEIKETARGESLDIHQFAKLSEEIKKLG
jgi:16S rRNA (adenine1518-N6/adenine1519-N6)-dimethyltransferase